jgi:hypothetical protein
VRETAIDDGYNITRTVPAQTGLFPEFEVTYRPAFAKERYAFQRMMNSTDAAVIDLAEFDLIVNHVLSVNGQPLGDKETVARLRPSIRDALVDLIMSYSSNEQRENAVNLAFGIRLQLIHPEIAARSCEDCQKWLYYDKGPNQFGERVERPAGVPVPRGPHIRPPCCWCSKIPAGSEPCPENAVELSPENFEAWAHYRECKAVGDFPTDAIVRFNASIIADAEAQAERVRESKSGLSLLQNILAVR